MTSTRKWKLSKLGKEIQVLVKESGSYRDKQFSELTSREQINILSLNRLLLTFTYPRACPRSFGGNNNEVLISFDVSPDKLMFAGDTDLFCFYNIYRFDPERGEIEFFGSQTKPPTWGEGAHLAIEKYYSQMSVKSPDGKQIAILKKINGLNRLEIQPVAKN